MLYLLSVFFDCRHNDFIDSTKYFQSSARHGTAVKITDGCWTYLLRSISRIVYFDLYSHLYGKFISAVDFGIFFLVYFGRCFFFQYYTLIAEKTMILFLCSASTHELSIFADILLRFILYIISP